MRHSLFDQLWVILIFCLLPNLSQSSVRYFNRPLLRIVLDAGHGGKDSGAIGYTHYEKDIALAIALKVGRYVEQNLLDVEVVYTRKDDVFVPLHERAELANEQEADLFISIHCNSLGKSRPHIKGTETYVMGLHRAEDNLATAKRENQAIYLETDYKQNYETFAYNSDEMHIMLSLYQSAFLEQSIALAEKVEGEFESIGKRESRGVKQAGFLVLRETTMPSILIETGFLSNPEEERFLASRQGQSIMASSIYRAIKKFRLELEGKEALKMIPEPTVEEKDAQVRFSIELENSKAPINVHIGKWKRVPKVRRDYIAGSFRYITGNYLTESGAEHALKFWQDNGFRAAKIVAYKNSTVIPLSLARELLRQQNAKKKGQ